MMEILFEDAHIAVVIKPPGVPAQPDKTGDEDVTALLAKRKNGGFCGVVHRLDRTVGGVMVYAYTPKAAAALSAAFAGDGAEKKYLAVAVGELAARGTLMDYLLKNERLNVSKVVPRNTPHAKQAMLGFECLAQCQTEAYGGLNLLRIQLQTGRHHQIRVQLANAGAPLWGDVKYNPTFARKRGVFPAL